MPEQTMNINLIFYLAKNRKMIINRFRLHSRAISSGVERLVDIEEVTSSNLVSPTIPLFFNSLAIIWRIE